MEAEPSQTVWTSGVLFGRELLQSACISIIAKGGPSLTGGVQRTGDLLYRRDCDFGAPVCLNPGTYRSKKPVLPGLVGEAEIVVSPLPFLGVGTHVRGTANSGRSFLSFDVSATIGM